MFSSSSASQVDATGGSKTYVDDCFSTYLYTGNGSGQTINNGIDLAGKGGMVWTKQRNAVEFKPHAIQDTLSPNPFYSLFATSTESEYIGGVNGAVYSYTSTGYTTFGATAGNTYVGWTFRRSSKFFDVVRYTGNGAANRQISHSLGTKPGMIFVKSLSTATDWVVYHITAPESGARSSNLGLNKTNGFIENGFFNNHSAQTSSYFTLGDSNLENINFNGTTYVAYLFAHDPSADGIIQCGSYTGNGSATGPVVNLGWEPQYLMIKNASGTGNWQIIDSMRGMPVGSGDATLQANLSNAESSVDYVSPTATGFQVTSTSSEVNTNGNTYIYLAIRRPNKPPKTGAQVYNAIARTGTGAAATVTGVGFAPDLVINRTREASGGTQGYWMDRLRGVSVAQTPALTPSDAEVESAYTSSDTITSLTMSGMTVGASSYANAPYPLIHHFFRRAPGVFDEVCYTGTGVARTVNHNLGVVPELMIVKNRSGTTAGWNVYCAALSNPQQSMLVLNGTQAQLGPDTNQWNNALPTATQFSVGTYLALNGSGLTYVAYLFASLPGISKVGSYTGNGGTQTINCGFTTGARFFLVKATSTTGNWWVFDSARGVVSSFDPSLALNSTNAEVTSADAVDPDPTGIIVNQEATCSINANGVSYVFLAIA